MDNNFVVRDGLRIDNMTLGDTLSNILVIDNNGVVKSVPRTDFDADFYTQTQIGNILGGVTAITGYNKDQWDTAFGWGDHAGLYAATNHTHNYLSLAGGTLTGEVYFQDDGEGITFNGGARIYKKVGGGLTLRRHTDLTEVKIENAAGTTSWDIWHKGNLTNLNQLTNGPGYLTSTTGDSAYVKITGDTMTGRLDLSAPSGAGENDMLRLTKANGFGSFTLSNYYGDDLFTNGKSLRISGDGNNKILELGVSNTGSVSKSIFSGTVAATSFIKSGGTSTQFLKADGSVDSNIYLTSETDTLDSVTDRGNTTTNAITVGGATVNGDLSVSGLSNQAGIYSIENTNGESDVIKVSHPKGGSLQFKGIADRIGPIKITLPVRSSGTMFRFTLNIYDFASTKSISVLVGGQLGGTSDFVDSSTFTQILSGSQSGDLNIRFGYDITNNCIWVGDLDTAWGFTTFTITDFVGGYNGVTSAWAENWNISLVTAFDTVQVTKTNNFLWGDWNKLKGKPTDLATTGDIPTNYVTVDGVGVQQVSGSKNFSNSTNYFNGHHYFTGGSTGSHHPHYTSGSDGTGAIVNTRVYKDSSTYRTFILNGKTSAISWDGNNIFHSGNLTPDDYLKRDGSLPMTGDLIAQGIFVGGGRLKNRTFEVNGSAIVSSEFSNTGSDHLIDIRTGMGYNGLRFYHYNGTSYENPINISSIGGSHFKIGSEWGDSGTDFLKIDYSTGNTTFSGNIIKSGSSDSFMLLGGGGTKLLSDFQLAGDFLPRDGSLPMTGNLTGAAGLRMEAPNNLWLSMDLDDFGVGRYLDITTGSAKSILGTFHNSGLFEWSGNIKATSFINSTSDNNNMLLGGGGTKLLTDFAKSITTISPGTGLTGGGDLSANRTLSFDTTWGDARYLTSLPTHNHDSLYLKLTGGTLTGSLSFTPGGAGAALGSIFGANTTNKSYINFNAVSGSSDPGFIAHETSAAAGMINYGVIHLSPSDDNGRNDYVSIHGTNDPETVKIHTDGYIETPSDILAAKFIGPLQGNADSATNVAWTGVTGKPTLDNYVSWNLKTNGVQRTGMASGSSLDIVANNNIAVSYSAGGVVTLDGTHNHDTEYDIRYVNITGDTMTGPLTISKTDTPGEMLFDIQGSAGQLFSITDSLEGDLFSVNDISGLPIFTVNSDDLVTINGSTISDSFIKSDSNDTYMLLGGGGHKLLTDKADSIITISTGTGLTGGGDLSANRTLSFDTTWGDARYIHPHPYLPLAGGTMDNTNLVTNLNADLLDSQEGAYYNHRLHGLGTTSTINGAGRLQVDGVTPITSFNQFHQAGFHTADAGTNYTDGPYAGAGASRGAILNFNSHTTGVTQFFSNRETTGLWFRDSYNGWKPWVELYHSGNLNPTTFATSGHTHSNLTPGTGINGSIYDGGTAQTFSVAYGTTSTSAAVGNDSRILNGQTAYGWGNHASAGYLPISTHDTTTRQIDISSASLPVDYTEADVVAHLNTIGVTKTDGESLIVTVDGGTPAGGGGSQYTHPSKVWVDKTTLTGATVISNLTIDATGHPTDWVTRTLTAANVGAEPSFSKNTGFNKNYGTAAGTVAQGNDSRINNGQTAFGWGNHAGLYSTTGHTHSYLPLSGGTLSNDLTIINNTTQSGVGFYVKSNSGVPVINLDSNTNAKPSLIEFMDSTILKGQIVLERTSSQIVSGTNRNDIAFGTVSGAGSKAHIFTEGVSRFSIDSTGNANFTGTVTAAGGQVVTSTTGSNHVGSMWQGTQAEYDAIGTKDPAKLYFIK